MLLKIDNLYKWYNTTQYDPEQKELYKIITLGKIKGKDLSIIGTYGVMSLSFKLIKFANSIIAVHRNKSIINYCKKKNNKIGFKIGNITKLKFPDYSFDAIISAWSGLYYLKNKVAVIKELRRLLKNKGILLIEEADETSEYVKILNLILGYKKIILKAKRQRFEKILKRYFKLKKQKLTTYYYFKNKASFLRYFLNELVYHEKKYVNKKMIDKLNYYISNKKELIVKEKSIFYICKKY